MELSPQSINLQTELNYLDWVKIHSIFSDFDMTQPIEPPINQYTYPQVGVSQQIMNLQIE